MLFTLTVLLAIACDGLSADRVSADKRHLLVTFPWSTANIGDIAITPGLLSLIQEVHPGLPTVVIASREAETDNYRTLRDYLPRYLPGCKTIGYPFKLRLDPEFKEGDPVSAWRAFYQRWGASQLRGFENGTLSARIAARIADDILRARMCRTTSRRSPANWSGCQGQL